MRKSLKVVLIVCTAILLCSSAFLARASGQTASSTDWPMFRADPAHDGTGNGGPAVNSSLCWSFNTGVDHVSSSPAVANGLVYVGAQSGMVYALFADSGKPQWTCTPYPQGEIITSPAVMNGTVYIGSYAPGPQGSVRGVLCALSAATGIMLWDFPAGGSTSSPTAVDGVIYFGSYDGNIYAVNATSGAKLWNYTTQDGVMSTPAIANGIVYVGSYDNNVYALNAANGALLWKFATGGEVYSSPAISSGTVYVGSADNYVYALNAATGDKLWRFATNGIVESSPAVAGGIVYVGSSDHNIYALNATSGAKIWSYQTGDTVTSSPAVVGGYVYASSFDDNIYALGRYNGTKLWSYTTSAPVSSSPAVSGGVVYVGSDDGNVYALGAQPAAPAPTPVVLYPNTYVINVDGSITPDTNLIKRTGNTFSLTGDVNQEIWIKMNNAVLEGAGHRVADPVFAMDATNVTIQNLSNTGEIDVSSASNVYVLNNTLAGTDWPWYESGVMQVDGSNHVTIKGNSITGGDYGIIISSSQNVLITENNVTGMSTIWKHPAAAIMFSNASNNLIYHNNFVNDALGTYSYGVDSNNMMDNGAAGGGNYWSDGSGAQWGDRYPLEKPFSTSTTVLVQSPTPLAASSPTLSPLSSTTIPSLNLTPLNLTQSLSPAQTQMPLPTSTQPPTAEPASTPKDIQGENLTPMTVVACVIVASVVVGLLTYFIRRRGWG